MKQPSMSHELLTKRSCMNSSPEQQPNTVEWLQPPQLRHASTTPTPCWFTNPDFSRALLHEQVTGISGWQGEAIPPRVEQYSQLHEEKAKGLFRTLAIPKRFRGIHVFSSLMSWPWNLAVVSAFSYGRTSMVSFVAILEWQVLLNSLKTEESVLTYRANTGEWWEDQICTYGSNVGERQATTMSLEEVETPFFVRSLADLSRHFFAASPKPQGRYAFPAASFGNSLTAESTAHWAQWHCNQAHIANHFAFRFQGPAHSMILGSCCTEKIGQCGIRVEPHQKSAYSEMNWTELNNLVQSMNGKDHLICTWRTTFLPPGSSCRSLETFALQPWLQTMDQPQKKTRETATVSCTILLPVWGILVGGCHIPCPVSFVLFLPQKPQAQICLSRII